MISQTEKKIGKLNSLIDSLENSNEKQLVTDAFNYIKTENPGINKALDVAFFTLEEASSGIETFVAAFLYASGKTENTDEINSKFGKETTGIIESLLKINNFISDKYITQTENFIKLILTASHDIRTIIVLLAEQIYHIRNFNIKASKEEKLKAAQKSEFLYAPIAHRLGLYKIKTELEELSVKLADWKTYSFISDKLKESKSQRDKYIQSFIKPIEKKLNDTGFEFNIKGRPKSIYSIRKKMKVQDVPFEKVYDLFAIRIILNSSKENEKSDCWNVYSIITDAYKPNPKRLRDWISSPKSSGYESLHTTVLGPENKWIEVQIRTERMDEVAEKGVAAHWIYKGGKGKSNDTDFLSKIREMLENPSNIDSYEETQPSLYSDEIFIFTPDGDIKSLKKGYTILDFAFSVHSKIGETCSGAVVNGKICPISQVLENGDTVKILTNKNKKPNSEWLKFAKSTKARNKIKRAIKNDIYPDAERGKELIKYKLDQLSKGFTDENLLVLVDFHNLKSIVELYQLYGEGKADELGIKKIFDQVENKTSELKKAEEITHEAQNEVKAETVKHFPNDILLIDEISALDFQFAKCCNPLPSDEIFGFITATKGTKIHKKVCPNANEMRIRYPYRIVKTKWNTKNKNLDFDAEISIQGTDKSGITSEITNIITKEFEIPLKEISFKAEKGRNFTGKIRVGVKSKDQLKELTSKLKLLNYINEIRVR